MNLKLRRQPRPSRPGVPATRGHLYAHQAGDDRQWFADLSMKSPTDYIVDMVSVEPFSAGQRTRLTVSGNIGPLVSEPAVSRLGEADTSFPLVVDGVKRYVRCTPVDEAGSFVFSTSDGIRGTAVVDHNSPWAAVAIVGIVAIAVVTMVAIDQDTSLKISATASAEGGSVEVEVNGGGDGDDGDGGDGGDGGGDTGGGGDGGGNGGGGGE